MSDGQTMVPQEIDQKMLAWRKWRAVWNWVHYGLGFVSAALSTIIAAHTKSAFMPPDTAVIVAAVAAGLAFLVTSLSASAKGAAFETAAREIERAIALYRGGEPAKILYQAEARGIDILNRLKS